MTMNSEVASQTKSYKHVSNHHGHEENIKAANSSKWERRNHHERVSLWKINQQLCTRMNHVDIDNVEPRVKYNVENEPCA